MKLSKLLENIEVQNSYTDVEISSIANNTDEVTKNSLYVCIKGHHTDGHNFAGVAQKAGAAAIICEKEMGLINEIIVKNSSETYAKICYNYFDNPQNKLTLIGITGTNGKTSTSYIIKGILEGFSKKCGIVGTIENDVGDKKYASNLTTPDAKETAKLLNEMAEMGCEYAIVEASSHALSQNRLSGCQFKIAVFTNLSQDHLDYHKDMDDYLLAKKRLFFQCDKAIINLDDEVYEKLCENLSCEVKTYSAKSRYSDYKAENIVSSYQGIRYEILSKDELLRVNFKTPGITSVYNTLAAISAVTELGFSLSDIAARIKEIEPIKGRLEKINTEKDFGIIIDYAHTPDGLYKVIKTVKEFTGNRLLTLVGCGGDRDKSKRAIMGEIATKFSDFAIITSDNPRTENPKMIIDDILKGVKGDNYIVIENRKDAIHWAINHAESGDIVLLAGKGHETYQILGKDKINFDEREIIKEYIWG